MGQRVAHGAIVRALRICHASGIIYGDRGTWATNHIDERGLANDQVVEPDRAGGLTPEQHERASKRETERETETERDRQG
jgi:hypothetical protein